MSVDTNLMNDPELIQDFFNESNELLERLDEDLVLLESKPEDKEILNRIFRAMHTIKGTAGFLGLETLVNLTHSAEEILNTLRKGEQKVTVPVLNVLLEATDATKILVNQVKNSEIPNPPLPDLLHKLSNIFYQKETTEESIEVQQASQQKNETPVAADKTNELNDQTVRIKISHIDDMINLVGEMVIERNRLLQIHRQQCHKDDNFSETVERISFITSELQMAVLKSRMLPVGRVFRKFPRVVRDLSHELGKEIQILISGEESELDKSMVDELNEPLLHIIRNSVSHGIEPPEERIQNGKPRQGTIYLSAVHDGNGVTIRIKDDGRGLQADKILKRAIEKRLVSADQTQELSHSDVIEFIFQPGFSTMERANEVSGRGVGLDIVRNKIKKMNGMIEIVNEPGKGCEFVLKLPLTLAIIQTLLVESGGEVFAIPLPSVLETLRVPKEEIKSIGKHQTLIHRGGVLHLVNLARIFNLNSNHYQSKHTYIVVIGIAEKRYGLIVDRLHGQEEVVIKPLSEGMPMLSGLAGSMIMGDGRVRLILEPSQLI